MATQLLHKPRAEPEKALLAGLVSLSPLYVLYSLSTQWGLDKLHLGLIEVVFFLVLRKVFSLGAGGRASTSIKAATATSEAAVPSTSEQLAKPGTKTKRKVKKASICSAEQLDVSLANFLSITEPSYLPLVASKPDLKGIEPMPLDGWNSLLKQDKIAVMQHPKNKALYAIQAHFEDVPLRQLFELVCDVKIRKEWDALAQGTEEVEEIRVGGRRANVAWLGMLGMAIVKPKDLVLLSVAARLPGSPKEKPDSDKIDHPIRLICASQSFVHPKVPPKPAFNRMELQISGFIAEEDETGKGSKITQITDLSGLGNWIPGAVIKTVTQVLIPKSLSRLGKAAKEYNLKERSKYSMEGNDWIPPVLGDFKADDEEEEEVEGSSEEEDEEVEGGGDLHSLVSQLRTLAGRLSALESRSGSSSPGGRSWSAAVRSSLAGSPDAVSTTAEGGFGQMTARAAGVSLLGALGGAGAAATLWAIYNRRRK